MSNQNQKLQQAVASLDKFSYSGTSSKKAIQERRRATFVAQSQNYTEGMTVQIDIASTHDYMYGPNSMLCFDLTLAAAIGADFPIISTYEHSSLSALFDEFKLTAKSVELEHQRGLDSLVFIKDHYACSKAYLESTGTMQGYDRKANMDATVFNVCIPLHHISGFFSQDKYLPLPQMGQMQLELHVNSIAKAFTGAPAGALPTAMTISRPRIIADLYRVNDGLLESGRMTAAKGQIMLTYDSYFYNYAAINAGQNQIEVKKAVSKAMSVISRVHDVRGATSVDEYRLESQKSKVWDVSSWQYVLGSASYPLRPITNAAESYAIGLDSFGLLDNCLRVPSVNLDRFKSGIGIMAVDLEKDVSEPEASAVSTKENARVSLELTVVGAPAGTYVETWLHYVRGAVVSTDSISVKE
jgi:hypothetical protein